MVFTTISEEDGLADNTIFYFLQGSEGFMWIGTNNGLDRFDGKHFLNFRFDPEDNGSISGNSVRVIFEDAQTRLWVGTFNGLNLLNKESNRFRRIPFVDGDGKEITIRVMNIIEYASQHLLIATAGNGLFKLRENPSDNQMIAEPFLGPNGNYAGILQSRYLHISPFDSEYLWIGTNTGVDRLHAPSGKIKSYSVPGIKGLKGGPDDILFADFLDGRGHYIFNREGVSAFIDLKNPTSEVQPIEKYFEAGPPKSFPVSGFSRIQQDGTNRLIVSTVGEELYWLDLVDGSSYPLDDINFQKYFSPARVSRITKDRSGNLWFGTYGGGIIIGSRHNDFIRFYRHHPDDRNAVSPGQIRSFAKDDRGNLWLASIPSGLDQFALLPDESLQKIRNLSAPYRGEVDFQKNRIINLAKDHTGHIWIATTKLGMYRMNPQNRQFEQFSFDPDGPVDRTISHNRIWGLGDRSG